MPCSFTLSGWGGASVECIGGRPLSHLSQTLHVATERKESSSTTTVTVIIPTSVKDALSLLDPWSRSSSLYGRAGSFTVEHR